MDQSTDPDVVTALVLLASFICVYLLPTLVAFGRGHHQRAAILLTNLFLGWTFFGWIAALIWSVTAMRQPQTIIYNNIPAPARRNRGEH